MKRKLIAIISVISIISIFSIASSAAGWYFSGVSLSSPSTAEMYYEAGVGTNNITALTKVSGSAGIHNVYVALTTRDSGGRLIQNDNDETMDYKYIQIEKILPNALNIVKHIRTAHIVELGTQTVGHRNIEKTYNGVEWVDCRC